MSAKQFLTCLWVSFVPAILAWAQGPNQTGTYYEAANGKSGAALKTAFFEIINGSYQDNKFQQIQYGSGQLKGIWGAFQTTDVLDDGVTIRDRYSNITAYQVGVDQQGLNGTHTNSQEGGTDDNHVYSREHSMPKSWFGGGTDVGPSTDIFHIYPVDSYMNSMRNNHPFGENDGEMNHSEGYYSKLGKCTFEGYTGTCFEPNDEWKGDFARTYFYMVTCYETSLPTWFSDNSGSYEGCRATFDGNTYPGLSEWQLAMLLKWSRQDPVDSIELARNEAVCSIQHNRNPFIDYPGLEEYVWGTKTAEAFIYDSYGVPDTIVTPQPVRKYLYRKTLIITAGKRYLIVADNNGQLRMAQPLATDYGYIQAQDVTAVDDIITLEDTISAFTFLAADDGNFYIKDSSDRFVYQTENYNSFNVLADMPESGAEWTVQATDNAFTITNVEKQKYVQYSTRYKSFGCYTNQQGLLPTLYEEVLMGDVNRDGYITIADVTALVNIILGKATLENDADKYDFYAADVNQDSNVTIADVTALVNIILGKTN